MRELNYGSDAAMVGRTLLTAKELLNPSYLPQGLNLTDALRLCFEALKDLAATSDLATALKQDQLAATGTAGSSSSRGGGIAIPAIGNLLQDRKISY
jgi:hypothetical protein